jgi:hypothetical protein
MRLTATTFAILLLALPAFAQDPLHKHDKADDAAKPPYSPGLGEIMTLQQMRHQKLWLAGAARSWELAGYELDELKEGFDDVAKYFPEKDGVPLKDMVAAVAERDVAALESAIKGKDGKKFAAAFDGLTQACNSCHQASKHGFIVIKRPTGSPYTNQDFAPPRK